VHNLALPALALADDSLLCRGVCITLPYLHCRTQMTASQVDGMHLTTSPCLHWHTQMTASQVDGDSTQQFHLHLACIGTHR